MNALVIAVACALVVTCQAGTTAPPAHTHRPHHTRDPSVSHSTKEPNEHEQFLFFYDPRTHHMVLSNGHNCYVDTTLTADQMANVHTDDGMRALEFKVLQQLSTFAATTKDMLDNVDVHHCGHHATNFFILQ